MEIGKYILILFKHVYLYRNLLGIIILCSFILWILLTFILCKWFKKNIIDNVHYFDYSPKSLKNLNTYGDLPIKNVYVVRESICTINSVFFNILTLNNYSRQINEYSKEIEDEYFFPKHTYLLVEVKMPNECIKKIVIDKSPQLCITLYLKLYDNSEILKFNVKKKKITLRELLDNTRERIGGEKFFNWNIFTNNCQLFTYELLNTFNMDSKKQKYLAFIDQSKFKERLGMLNDFTIHLFNCCTNIYSFLYSSLIEM